MMSQRRSLSRQCLCLLLLALMLLTMTPSAEARRKSRRSSGVHIEIYYPKGVTVWYPQRPGMVMFGVEIFLNQKHLIDDESVCNVCMNTTETAYGKFILHDPNAIIRGGDHLMYNALKQKVDGDAYVMKSDEFYVSESRMIPQELECSSGTKQKSSKNLEERVAALQNVIIDLLESYTNSTTATKNIYIDNRPEHIVDPKDLYEYANSTLKGLLPTIAWDKVLVSAFRYDSGIGVEVKTMVDKLMILQLAKNLPFANVTDMDEKLAIEDNSIDSMEN